MDGSTETRLRRLADAARSSAEVAEDDRAARDLAIAEADAAGMKLTRISEVTGLAISHVSRIVVRVTADAQAATEAEEAP